MKKKNYRKVTYWWHTDGQFAYEHVSGAHMCRRIRTFPERRQWIADDADEELRDLGCRPRGGRSPGPLDPWNDYIVSRTGGRSWKDYTRARKQWDRDDRDATPYHPESSSLWATLRAIKMELERNSLTGQHPQGDHIPV